VPAFSFSTLHGVVMPIYADLATRRGSATAFNKLQPAAPSQLVALEQHAALPGDYVAFLREVGWGELGDGRYMLYSGLLEPDSVYASNEFDGKVLLFGDDFCGYNAGFRLEDWRVVEIDSTDMRVEVVAESFEEFIRKTIARIESA
jgi:hypothetical protein